MIDSSGRVIDELIPKDHLTGAATVAENLMVELKSLLVKE